MTDLLGPASAPNAVTARLAEYRTFGTTDTWFKPCSNPASQDGTAIQAAWLNGVTAQLRAAIRGNGNLANGTGPVVPEVNTSDAMLLLSTQLLIARGQSNCGTDTGTADALAVAPATPWPEYKAGARIWVMKSSAAGSNATAAPTLAVSGLAAVTIVRRDGSALLPGDLPAGAAFCAEFDGTYFRLVALTWGEIASAVQSGKWLYGVATGVGNAATVVLLPSQAPIDGTEILVKWPGTNTAVAPTFLLTNFVVKTVVRQAGGQIQPGDLSGYVPLIYDATLAAWRVNGLVASDVLGLTLFYGADTSAAANQVTVAIPAFAAGPTVGRLFDVKIANSITGATQINVNGSGNLPATRPDGTALKAGDLRAGQVAAFAFDGTNVQYLGSLGATATSTGFQNEQVLSGSGTFTVPAGIYRIYARVWGGGGAGGASGSGQGAGGGGGGGYAEGFFAVTPGQAFSYAVGAGGIGSAGASGQGGGTTTFGALLSATGGGGGSSVSPGFNGGGSGVGSGGSLQGTGGNGGAGTTSFGGAGGSGSFGGGSANFSSGLGSAGNFPGGGGTGFGPASAQAGSVGAAGSILIIY